MKHSAILRTSELGQSVWLDDLSRDLLASGKLEDLIHNHSLRGVTSNPKIFSEAIMSGSRYREDIEAMGRQGRSGREAYEALAVQDVQAAANLLGPVYDATQGLDGFVSLEVSPHLANDAAGTIEEARRLWKSVDRPNTMIKVPATSEGLDAVRVLIADGISVNVTLLFGISRYLEVTEAYMAGLRARAVSGARLYPVSSVASFFLSRIDVLVDEMLGDLANRKTVRGDLARQLRGKTAIASAKLAYRAYRETFSSPRFRELAEAGARPQRLLWGSMSTKNPDYSDVMYVNALIGPETVATLPMGTLKAFEDHGDPQVRLDQGMIDAVSCVRRLEELGIGLDAVSSQLLQDGVRRFAEPFDKLLAYLERVQSGAKPARAAAAGHRS